MSNEVMSALLEIKGTVGEIKAGQADLQRWMAAHAEEDRLAHERIGKIELKWARMRGAITVAMAVATGVGAVLAFFGQLIVEWVKGGVRH